jgi:hypothetical protein
MIRLLPVRDVPAAACTFAAAFVSLGRRAPVVIAMQSKRAGAIAMTVLFVVTIPAA